MKTKKKTIAQIISAIRKGGFKVDSRESTWAESKWWLAKKDGSRPTEQNASEIRDYLRFTAHRNGRVEIQTEAVDGFSGIFLAFPLIDKAARLISHGIDPGDFENSV